MKTFSSCPGKKSLLPLGLKEVFVYFMGMTKNKQTILELEKKFASCPEQGKSITHSFLEANESLDPPISQCLLLLYF